MTSDSRRSSTGALLNLCGGYFFFYVINGLAIKYFTGPSSKGFPGMGEMDMLAASLLGWGLGGLGVVFVLRWYRAPVAPPPKGFSPYFWAAVAGVCNVVVTPATTLMYTLPISVMVAMILMRSSVLVASRAVDWMQQRQGLLKKRIFMEENVAIVLALMAAGIYFASAGKNDFDFIHSKPAVIILTSYIAAYALRIYAMNYYKNTRPHDLPVVAKSGAHAYDEKWFFSMEKVATLSLLALAGFFFYFMPGFFGWTAPQLSLYRRAWDMPNPFWTWAALASISYGIAHIFSVLIYVYKGRSATFAALANRLSSLIAGTAATLIFWAAFQGKFPKPQDWVSLGFVLAAVACLGRAERRRAAYQRSLEVELVRGPETEVFIRETLSVGRTHS